MRIGMGYDGHKFELGRPLRLGGIDIPYEYGLAGHSDGDVAVHAVIDALLGAAALGDIGGHFPSDAPKYKNVNSITLLGQARDILYKDGWQVCNVDVTIIAEYPRIAPLALKMRLAIGEALQVGTDLVSVKGTTVDDVGSADGDGIIAHAVVLIEAVL